MSTRIIAVGGLACGFVALCIGIAFGMNGALIAFAAAIAGMLAGAVTAPIGVNYFMQYMINKGTMQVETKKLEEEE